MAVSDSRRFLAKALYINDFDTSRLGLIVDSAIERHRGGLSFPDRTTALPGRVGTIALAREFESNPRRVVVVGTQDATSASQLIEDVNELKARCYAGTVELRFTDDANKVYLARCEDITVTPTAPALRRSGKARHRVRITFLCQDPLIYDRYATVVGFSTAGVETPLGTAISLPEVQVNGPTTQGFTVTYKDFRGTSQATLALSSTLTLSSTEYVTIDHELSSITGTTGNNLLSALSTGSSFFGLDRQDAAGSTGAWPTLSINTTGMTGQALYKKAYL